MKTISFEADTDPSVAALRDEIRARRVYGVVRIEYRRFTGTTDDSTHAVATAFVASLGMQPSHPFTWNELTWNELDVDRALVVATRVLHKQLAYESDVMPLEAAADLARRFVESCGGAGATFVTNGTLGLTNENSSWLPLTNATFDTGVVAVSQNDSRVAILWVEDED